MVFYSLFRQQSPLLHFRDKLHANNAMRVISLSGAAAVMYSRERAYTELESGGPVRSRQLLFT